jgi:hypothetical protein
MPQVGEIAFHVQGDIGGVGISRFRFTRQDAGSIMGTDVNAAAAAARALLAAGATYYPTPISWTCQAQVDIYDVASGLVQGPLIVTALPATVNGTGGSSFSAGTGGRINWKTSTLSGRRLLKGATFLVPLSATAFTSNGAVANGTVTAINTAVATYINAMTTATLYPVIWHRPKKGATVGGLTGIVTAGALSATPSGLRSRRT